MYINKTWDSCIRISIRIYLDHVCMAECMTSQVVEWHAMALLSLQAEMSHFKTVLDADLSVDVIDRVTNAIREAQTAIAMCTAYTGPLAISVQNHHLTTIFAMYAILSMCLAAFVVVVYCCLPSGLRKVVEGVYRCISVISPLVCLVALYILHTGGYFAHRVSLYKRVSA